MVFGLLAIKAAVHHGGARALGGGIHARTAVGFHRHRSAFIHA